MRDLGQIPIPTLWVTSEGPKLTHFGPFWGSNWGSRPPIWGFKSIKSSSNPYYARARRYIVVHDLTPPPESTTLGSFWGPPDPRTPGHGIRAKSLILPSKGSILEGPFWAILAKKGSKKGAKKGSFWPIWGPNWGVSTPFQGSGPRI